MFLKGESLGLAGEIHPQVRAAFGLPNVRINAAELNLKPLITHRFSLDDINEAFTTFAGRIGGAIKVIVKPGG